MLLLEFCHPAQLSRSDEARERFVCLWLFADTQGESLSGHTHAGIDAKLLWLISLGYAAGTMKTLEEVISKYPKILTRTCAFHWLSNPFHTLDSFRKSLNFVEAYLAKYHRFDWLLSDLIDDLLGNATAVRPKYDLTTPFAETLSRVCTLITFSSGTIGSRILSHSASTPRPLGVSWMARKS